MKNFLWMLVAAFSALASRQMAAQPRSNVYLQHNLVSDLPSRA